MSNNLTFPTTVYGYWRPWKSDANYWHDYLDYVRDASLVNYGANTIGKCINQASQEQIEAINIFKNDIGKRITVLNNQLGNISNQINQINEGILNLNRNLDIQIEQQRLSNILLKNISALLRIPDSEKERQHSIELGIKFFVNAQKDSDLYDDALEELLKAESERTPGIKLKVRESLEKGEPIPDEIILRLVDARLRQSDCRVNGWVLDGFPENEA